MKINISGFKLLLISICFTIPFISWSATRIVKSSRFDSNCTYHLLEAASTTDQEYMVKELNKSIQYIEEHNLTQGYTSLLDRATSEDLGVWYKDIRETNEYFTNLKDNPTVAQVLLTGFNKKNLLLRDHKPFVVVHIPDGISVYPYNVLYCWWGILGFVMLVLGVIGIVIYFNEE